MNFIGFVSGVVVTLRVVEKSQVGLGPRSVVSRVECRKNRLARNNILFCATLVIFASGLETATTYYIDMSVGGLKF